MAYIGEKDPRAAALAITGYSLLAAQRLGKHAVSSPVLTRVEQEILEILESYQGDEVLGRELRGLVQSRGFRRSAPAFVFTMMRLVDKGLVTCREEVRVVDGVEVRERYYGR